MALETIVMEIMAGKRRGRSVLHLLSWLYHAAVSMRNAAYNLQILRSYSVGMPVVSVGNIMAGGTGKTPLVIKIAEELAAVCKTAVLSRGYKAAIEKSGKIIRVTSESDPKNCGDEALLLACRLPKASVWAGVNRVDAALFAKAGGAQVVVLDDGMQHRRLQRDFEVVVVDGDAPFGNGYYLPRGMLRDSPARLKHASLVIINNAKNPQETAQLIRKITQAPLVATRMQYQVHLQGKKVAVFCAIGQPDRFMQAVRARGGEIVATLFKPDHDPFTIEELNSFAKRSKAELLICTEKDRIKLPKTIQCHLPIIVLEGHLEIIAGKESWDAMIQSIKAEVLSCLKNSK